MQGATNSDGPEIYLSEQGVPCSSDDNQFETMGTNLMWCFQHQELSQQNWTKISQPIKWFDPFMDLQGKIL